jgi:hypothetical protein
VTKEEVVAAILDCTEKLGYVPSRNELRKHGRISREQLERHFGSFTKALPACSLKRKAARGKLEMEDLFMDWASIVRTLGKHPTGYEYEERSKYSQRPLLARFGSWAQVPPGLKMYAEENGMADEWKDVMEIVAAQHQINRKRESGFGAMVRGMGEGRVFTDRAFTDRAFTERPMYGPLMRPCPLICGPINEAGVVYLFGTMAEQMGYVVLRMQSEFPDCEALRLVEDERWQRVRIEFEYESRNFLKHFHDVNDCDVIVCWRHNWPECPLEVVELRAMVREQMQRPVN